MREINVRDYRIRLDLTPQVLRVECPEDIAWQQEEVQLSPTIAPLRTGRFVSASILAQKAKLFDDGLVAAAEIAAQRGCGSFTGKMGFLVKIAKRLAGVDGPRVGDAAAVILAACELNGMKVGLPEGLAGPVRARVAEFLGDELSSRPLGFYSWSQELAAIFQQDRMLQSELRGSQGIEILVRAIHGDPLLRTLYNDWLSLAYGLTNPPAKPDLRPLLAALDHEEPVFPEGGVHFLPPSESPEGALLKKLYGNRPIPEGFSLADALVERVRSGEVNLAPGNDSGWYDHVVWSLETLAAPSLAPEAARVEFGPRYNVQIAALLKGILALARETHVKQLERPAAGAGMPERRIEIPPELSAEPLATHYRRRALSYRFVRQVLESAFGATALDDLHRLTPSGPSRLPLGKELTHIETMFNGAYATTMRELGLIPEPGLATSRTGGADGDAVRFAGWAADQSEDPDLFSDSRMMVPVFYDVQRRKMKVWAFLGWASRPLSISFKTPPSYEVHDHRSRRVDKSSVKVEFVEARQSLIYPVTVETYVSKLLNRDEFAAHCDRWKTQRAIVENLD